jgi:hypothetical protein
LELTKQNIPLCGRVAVTDSALGGSLNFFLHHFNLRFFLSFLPPYGLGVLKGMDDDLTQVQSYRGTSLIRNALPSRTTI